MPTYDYRCRDCRKRAAVWQSYADYGRQPVACPHCGSQNLKRLISRVRLLRSEDSRLDDLSDPTEWGDVDENDPRSMARAMRRMGQEMGEDLPDEFDEMVDRLDSGEDPESIESGMPGGGDDGGEDLGFD
jgi:putative FmdB family regulatory protein